MMDGFNPSHDQRPHRGNSRQRKIANLRKTVNGLVETVQAHDPESLLWEIEQLKLENAGLRRQLDIARQS